jgi:hypothetical protein
MNTKRTGIVVLCIIIAALVGTASGLGVFLRGSGRTLAVESPRGEQFEMVTDGIYQFNSQRLVAEGIGWDIITLFVVVPVLLVAITALGRGSLRGRLLTVGILAYFFYQYLMYAVTWAFGPLFLLFVVIYALSAVGIVWIVSGLDVGTLPQRFDLRFPARGMAIFSVVMALLLVGMWLGRIVPALRGEIQGLLLGQTTMVVQAMDLGIVVPLALWTGFTAWRKRPVGYLLAAVFVVKGAAMALAITAMVISAWIVEGAPELPPLVLFAVATVVSIWLGQRIYRSAGRAGSAE